MAGLRERSRPLSQPEGAITDPPWRSTDSGSTRVRPRDLLDTRLARALNARSDALNEQYGLGDYAPKR
jgi:hypothetical protein